MVRSHWAVYTGFCKLLGQGAKWKQKDSLGGCWNRCQTRQEMKIQMKMIAMELVKELTQNTFILSINTELTSVAWF